MKTEIAPSCWFAACLVVYLLCGADVFYKSDGPDLLRLLHEGNPHPWHVGYLPLLSLWRGLLAAVGIAPDLLRLGTSFSAVGAALGVAFFRAAAGRVMAAPWRAELATLLLAVNPATFLFATVVEFHAVQLAAVGAAIWWAVRSAERPRVAAMILLGLLTHAAFLLHSSGLLLPAWLLPYWLALRRQRGGGRFEWRLPAVAGLVHVAAWLLLPQCLPAFYGVHGDFATAYGMETSIGRPQSLDHAPTILVQEWLAPLLPVSVLCWLALGLRERRGELLALLIGLLPFLYLCVRQLVFEPEHGAYMLPLVPAAALLSAAAMPRQWPAVAAVAAVSLVLAIAQRDRALPERASYGDFVAGLRAAAQERPFFALLGRHDEMAMAYARLEPDRDFVWIRAQATMPRADYGPGIWQATVGGLRLFAAAGRTLLLSDGALAWLRDPAAMRMAEKPALPFKGNDTMAGPLFLHDLEATFVLEPAAGPPQRPAVYRLVFRQ